MGVDDREGGWKLDGEVRVVADGVEVKERYMESFGMLSNGSEDGGIDRGSDEDERIWREDLVFRDEGFKRLHVKSACHLDTAVLHNDTYFSDRVALNIRVELRQVFDRLLRAKLAQRLIFQEEVDS